MTSSTAVTKAADAAPAPAATEELPYFLGPVQRPQIYSSIPKERAEEIIAAMNGADARSLGSQIGKTFDVQDVVAHRVEVVDEKTGEVFEKDRVVLIAPDGAMLTGVSEGLKQSIQLMATFYGLPPWKPAKRVEIQQLDTRSGRRIFKLQPITTATAKVQK